MALQTYLVEHYRPGFTAERLEEWAARVRASGGRHRPRRRAGALPPARRSSRPTSRCCASSRRLRTTSCARSTHAPDSRSSASPPSSPTTAHPGDGEATKGHSPITTGPPRQRRAHRPGGHMFTSRTHRRTVIARHRLRAVRIRPHGRGARRRRTSETRAAARPRWSATTPSYPDARTTDPATSAALAQERYYSSYGEVEPRTVPRSPHERPAHDTQPAEHAVAADRALGGCRAGHRCGQRNPGSPPAHPSPRRPSHHVAAGARLARRGGRPHRASSALTRRRSTCTPSSFQPSQRSARPRPIEPNTW